MGVKMNLRIKTKNRAADPEIRILTKSISKFYGRATAMPPAWELRLIKKPIFLLLCHKLPEKWGIEKNFNNFVKNFRKKNLERSLKMLIFSEESQNL